MDRGCSRYRPLGPYCGDTCCHRYRHHLRSVDDRLAHLPRRLRLLRRAHHTTVGSPGRSNRHRHDPGHCHSRPHPDRPICPNRPVPTPHHPIPSLGAQPVQRRPRRPSHRPLTISETPLTRRQSGSVFEPVTNTRPSTALRPSFLTKTDQWEAFFPQHRTSAGARDPSPVKAP